MRWLLVESRRDNPRLSKGGGHSRTSSPSVQSHNQPGLSITNKGPFGSSRCVVAFSPHCINGYWRRFTEDNPAINLHPRSKEKSPDKELDFKRSKNSAAFSNPVGSFP